MVNAKTIAWQKYVECQCKGWRWAATCHSRAEDTRARQTTNIKCRFLLGDSLVSLSLLSLVFLAYHVMFSLALYNFFAITFFFEVFPICKMLRAFNSIQQANSCDLCNTWCECQCYPCFGILLGTIIDVTLKCALSQLCGMPIQHVKTSEQA